MLVAECFGADASREDSSLYETMKAIKTRLDWDLVLKHPVTPGETITNGSNDAKAKFFRERLKDALAWLKPLQEDDCTREKALKCWDKMFSTDFFSRRYDDEASKNDSGSSLLTAGIIKEAGSSEEARAAVRKEGGGRYA